MKKYITLFTMLLLVSFAFAQNTITNTKSDSVVTITVPDASFGLYDQGNQYYDSHYFSFRGYTADSSYRVDINFNTTDFHAGTYPDSLVDKSRSYLNDTNYIYAGIVRGLTDPEITITDGDVTKYYNLIYSFVGSDSVHYSIDMTFQVPYEETWHEGVVSDGTLDRSMLNYGYSIDFIDSLYRYELWLDAEVVGRDTLRFTPEETNDTCDFYVYDITDTNQWYCLYDHYSGWLAKTDLTDSTYRFVGEVLCHGNKKFYINCRRPEPATVKEVVMPTYNVFTEGNNIIVNNADGNRVTIYDASGRLIMSSKITSNNARFSLATGVYLVRINGSTTKVLCW